RRPPHVAATGGAPRGRRRGDRHHLAHPPAPRALRLGPRAGHRARRARGPPPQPGGRLPRPRPARGGARMIRTPAALRRPGRLVGRQMRFELRVFLRDRRATFFTLAFPLMMLSLYGAVFGDETISVGGHDVTWLTFWVPALATLSIVSASFGGL